MKRDTSEWLKASEAFKANLRLRADTLDVAVRQQILRLIVKEMLIGADMITLRHQSRLPSRGQRRTDRRLHPPVLPDQSRAQVIFCVRGVILPPWGVPLP